MHARHKSKTGKLNLHWNPKPHGREPVLARPLYHLQDLFGLPGLLPSVGNI